MLSLSASRNAAKCLQTIYIYILPMNFQSTDSATYWLMLLSSMVNVYHVGLNRVESHDEQKR